MLPVYVFDVSWWFSLVPSYAAPRPSTTRPTNDLKAKFEQDIKGATPKGTDTLSLRENVRKRGSIPNMTPSIGKLTCELFYFARRASRRSPSLFCRTVAAGVV